MKTFIQFTLIFFREIILFLLIVNSNYLFAQTPLIDDNWWQPNGPVSAIEYDTLNNALYIGGDFTSVAPNIRYNAFLNRTTGIPDLKYPRINDSQIQCSVADGNGGLFIAGSFKKVGDSLRNRIAHIDAAGKVTSLFANNGFNGNVFDIAMNNDTLYVVGDFSGYGKPLRNIIPYQINSAIPLQGFPDISSTVNTIIPDGNGGWFIGGTFIIPNTSFTNLIHVNSQFQIVNWQPSLSGTNTVVISALCLDGSTLYVGGAFDTINGQPRQNLAAFDITTGNLLPFNTTCDGYPVKICVHNNTLYLCGYFDYVGGQLRHDLAAIDIPTSVPLSWAPNPGGSNTFYSVKDILVKGDSLYVGGDFTYIAGSSREYIVSFELTNHTLTNWAPPADTTIYCIASYKDKIVTGGYSYLSCSIIDLDSAAQPTSYGAYDVHSLALSGDTLFYNDYTSFSYVPNEAIKARNLLNNTAVTWNSNSRGYVNAMACSNGVLLAWGSSLETVDGARRIQICSVDAVTGQITSWDPPEPNQYVGAIAANDSIVFIGGSFSIVGDSLRSCVAALSKISGNLTSWNGPYLEYGTSSRSVWSLYLKNNVLLAAGNIRYQHGGNVKHSIVALNALTGTVFPWTPSTTDNLYAYVNNINGNDSIAYICGIFDTVNAIPTECLAGINLTNGALTTFNLNLKHQYQPYILSALLDDTVLYIGGRFDSILTQPVHYLAAINPFTQQLLNFSPQPNAEISHIKAINNTLLISGGFNEISAVDRKNFAAFDAISRLPLNINPQPNKEVTSIAYSQNNIYLAGAFDTIGAIPRNSLAEINKVSGGLTSFDAQIGSLYRAISLLVDNNTLYAGGGLGTVMGQTRHGIASFDLTTGTLNPLDLVGAVGGSVNDIQKRNDTLYCMGGFTIGGGLVHALASVIISSNTITNLNAAGSAGFIASAGAIGDDKIYVGGTFIDSYDITTGSLNGWNPNIYLLSSLYVVNTISVIDSLVAIGGSFYNNPYPYSYFTCRGKSSGLPIAWNPAFNHHVNKIKKHKSNLFVGGMFTSGGSADVTRKYFAVFEFSNPPSITPPQGIYWCGNDTVGPLSFSVFDSVNVNAVTVAASSSDTTVVKNQNIIISGSGASRFITIIPEANSSSNCTIYLLATNQAGTTATTNFNFTNAAASVTISGNPVVCTGTPAVLSAGSGFISYQWNTGASTQSINAPANGTYWVTATNLNGCSSTDTVLVTINPVPVVSIASLSRTDICLGDSVFLYAPTGIGSYQWTQNNTPINGATSTGYYASSFAAYRCVVTDSNGCTAQSNALMVQIVCYPIDPIPDRTQSSDISGNDVSVFQNYSSPNFILKFRKMVSTGRIDVVNPLGELIFSNTIQNVNQKQISLKKLSNGVYFFRVYDGATEFYKKVLVTVSSN